MANRIEINEGVENALGLNITGASVTVRFRGGAQAPVYDRQNGGNLLTQPLSTVNGKIGGDSPAGAWVAEAPYDLDVVFGSDTLTFSWNANTPSPLVTTLPAGVGTSAPEDGEMAIELYDSANGGAWLRRWRAAVSAWDMIGGPPPSGAVLPGTPRVRQEFYQTGGSPVVQHLRFNGSTWDYVGTPPMVPVTGSPLTVLDVGQPGQLRAGRQLALADFTTLAGLPTTPAALYNLGGTTNLGTGAALTNKGTVIFGVGIEGVSNAAAQFTGSTAQALFAADTGAADPMHPRQGSFGCWIKTGKRGTAQTAMSKYTLASHGWFINVTAANVAQVGVSVDGASDLSATGLTDVADNRWHHIFMTADGTFIKLFVDGMLEAAGLMSGVLFASVAPLNIGGFGADGATAAAQPFFGLVDEACVTPDVASDEQVRVLYAAKVVHGYQQVPRLAAVNIRRRRRGASLVSADFPSQPARLHSFVAGALTDAGANNVPVVASNSPLTIAGPDGSPSNAYNFVGASTQFLSSTDAGLPAGTTSRSYGCWFKASAQANGGIMGWGTLGTNDARVFVNASGALLSLSGADSITGPFVADGLWHFVLTVEDNAAVDGLKRKVFLDGRLVVASTVLTSLTLAGAGKFNIGSNPGGATNFTGQIDEAFVTAIALTPEQGAALYQKSSMEMVGSPIEAGPYVEAMDAINAYVIFDSVDSNYRVDLAVAA